MRDDNNALRAISSEGLRMLQKQYQAHEAALSGAHDLLKLAVAAIGGTIVVSGIVSARDVVFDGLAWAGVTIGVSFLVLTVGMLAPLAAGLTKRADVVYGPDMARVEMRLRREDITEEQWLLSLIDATPTWLGHNGKTIARLQAAKGRAFVALALGVMFILSGLPYITGRSILGFDA